MSHTLQRMTTEKTLKKLKEGNERYQQGKMQHPRQDQATRDETAGGQQPFAAVLTCSDSRVPAEIIFDAGIGDVFPIELAGNFLSDSAKASVAYAVEHLNVPAVVVMGHSSCGAVAAVKSAVEKNEKLGGHYECIQKGLQSAVQKAKDKPGDWVENAAQENVRSTTAQIEKLISDLGKSNQCQAVGFYYDLKTGAAEQLNP